MIYGGGLKMGQVIGQSSRDGGEPESNGFNIENLMATIMHSLIDIGELRVTEGLPRNLVSALTAGKPITGLV